jgi:hypothetical protein
MAVNPSPTRHRNEHRDRVRAAVETFYRRHERTIGRDEETHMSNERQREPLRRVGSLWKAKPGQRSKGSGSITINGLRQRFIVLPNDRKQNESQPDYVLMSSDEPEVDEYARRSTVPIETGRGA